MARNPGVEWTDDERAKGTYIAKRAIRLGRDPLRDVMEYMGMPPAIASVRVREAREQLRDVAVHRVKRSA